MEETTAEKSTQGMMYPSFPTKHTEILGQRIFQFSTLPTYLRYSKQQQRKAERERE